MGSYTVIADVGQGIVNLLKHHMVPEVLQKEEQIGLCSPKETGEYRLGVYLFDMQESEGIRNEPKRWVGEETMAYPSMYLNLYYMLVPYSHSDLKYRFEEEHRILGRALQILRDFPSLNKMTYEEETSGSDHIQIEILDMSYEDKNRIWNGLNEDSRNAIYCKVSGVELESRRKQNVRRIREVQIQVDEGGSIHG